MDSPEIFRAAGLPVLQNQTFDTRAEALACPTGDVVLVQHPVTGLVFNGAFDPQLLQYDEKYHNEQACSAAFRSHLEAVAQIIERHWSGRSLVEVGCGKGFFLEHLRRRGFRITGIDPAYEGTNPDVVRASFDKRLGIRGDAVVLRHVLEHIQHPVDFLSEIAAANGGGAIYIEVPCLDWIVNRRSWFDIFYEHVNYFRLPDFNRMFGRVYEAGHLFGGQYLYAIADLASLRSPVKAPSDVVSFPADFSHSLEATLERVRPGGGRKVVWGGASKGVIFSLAMQRAGVTIDGVVDINPAKQGRYLGVSGLKVSAPEDIVPQLTSSDTVIVMNSNYLDEIVAATQNRFSYVTVDNDRV